MRTAVEFDADTTAAIEQLVTTLDLRGSLVADAVLAALCIEHG